MSINTKKAIDNQLDRLYESYGKLCGMRGIGASIMSKIVKRQIDKYERLKNGGK